MSEKKLVRVVIRTEYICYDSPEMIDSAKDAVAKDIYSMVKNDEVDAAISVEPAPDAKESDIPSFLLEEAAWMAGDEEE